MRHSEKLRQLGLGVQLRKLREDAGMTTRSLAKSLGVSPSSITRSETGLRAPSTEEVSALCALCGVTGEEKKALLEKVGDHAQTAAWVANGVPDQLASLMVLERESVAITDVQVSLIPGLAHTADYARLVLHDLVDPGSDLEKLVGTRLSRQAILSKPRAPEVNLFIEEGALHKTLGSREVLYEQLQHLLVLQRRGNVTIRILPSDSSSRPAIGTAFSLYKLAVGIPYVFVEVRDFGLFITEEPQVSPFVATCRSLQSCALGEDESSALIREIAESLDHD